MREAKATVALFRQAWSEKEQRPGHRARHHLPHEAVDPGGNASTPSPIRFDVSLCRRQQCRHQSSAKGVVLQQSTERVQGCRQIRQESSITVHQTKKTSKLAAIGRLWRVADRVHLGGQLVQSVSADCMAAVFGLGIEESCLRRVRPESGIEKALQHHLQVVLSARHPFRQ